MITKEARTATVTAETPLRCLSIRFWDFRNFVKENPDVSWKLLQHLVDLLGEKERDAGPARRRRPTRSQG